MDYGISGTEYISAKYKYKRLSGHNTVRIIELLPERDGEEIHIHLHEVTLQEAPAYQALSYEWGEIKGSHSIRCDSSILLVTTNLLAALRRLRFLTLRRYLWVDAICINQEDIEEKTKQVAMMGQIYKFGHKALIWLGEAGPGTTKAIAKLQDLAQEQEKLEAKKESFLRDYYHTESKRNQADARAYFRYSALGASIQIQSKWEAKLEELLKAQSRFIEDINGDFRQGLYDIFSRTYFQRLWIIQEVVLSPVCDVLCGADRCSWDIFSAAARYLRVCLKLPCDQILNSILQLSDMKGNLSYKYPDIMHLGYDDDEAGVWISEALGPLKAAELKFRRSLTFLLITFSRSKAQDPTDRIVALLSLTNEISQRLLKPNYSLGAGHVYQQAMMAAFSQNMGLILLEKFVPPSLSHIPGTPSWVPDFACFSPWCKALEFSEKGDLDFDPYGIKDDLEHGAFTVHGDLLSARGKVLDSIAYCTSIISPAEMYHFQSNYDIREGHLILDQCPPKVHDFTFIASVQEGVICYESNPWLLEKQILDIIQSHNGQAALQDNGTSLSDYRIHACYSTRKSKVDGSQRPDPQDFWLSQWESINKAFQLSQVEEKDLSDLESGLIKWKWEKYDYLTALRHHWAQQKWSSQLYVHNQGRQLLRTTDGWLAIGPVGINSVEVGDIIVTLGVRSAYYALRPLADGTYLLRGLVEVEDDSAGNYKGCKPLREFKIR
ncbi:HET-domain-containing protein [Stipitochalara longipes BDJ]|nr:HET-domain-containing protein [Stipitochalara longipes BDJ]